MIKSCWLVLIAACFAVSPGAQGAYLPELGPSPLRFRAPAGFVARVVLPPLQMMDAIVVTNAVASTPTNPPPVEPLAFVGPSPLETPSISKLTAGSTPIVAAEQALVMTPQMLVEFFKNVGAGTNLPPVSIVGVFTPPAPPFSSATYKSF
jgi:hypothetical protein